MEKIVVRVLQEIIKRISPELKEEVEKAVYILEQKAAATKNPWDDLAVKILKVALGID